MQVYAYNYVNTDSEHNTKIYKPLCSEDEDKVPFIAETDDKQLRINVLLYIRQFKNTYYKYTNKEKFSPELYNSFINDTNFDGGTTGFDDDDTDIRIFDKYVLDYIKHRNEICTYLQCKNKDIILKQRLDALDEVKFGTKSIDIMFAIDMTEKDLFNYTYSIVQATCNVSMVKNIVFSLIFKYNSEYIRIKLDAYKSNRNSHPYLILERFIA